MPVEITITRPQAQFINSTAPHPALVAGYGAGKSQAAVLRTVKLALQYPGMSFAFVEPTFDLVKLIAWPRFESILGQIGIGYELNKSDSIMRVANDSQIIFRSADNPERMIGYEVADGVIDEIDTLKTDHAAEVWSKMLGRCRQRKPDGADNTLAAASTPEGFRFVYQTWGKSPRPGYELIRAPTASNPYLPAGYIDSLRNSYSDQQLAAYLDGEFVNLTAGSVYAEFDRKANSSAATFGQREHVHIGMDFNVNNMSAVACAVRDGKVYAIRELVQVRDTPSMIALIKRTFPGHPVTVYPDASGAKTVSSNASLSDISLLRGAGFTVLAHATNPRVRDRVAAMCAMIHRQGLRRLFVDPTGCPTLIDALEQQAYDKNGDPDKSGGHDHVNDALGYLVAYLFGIARGPATFAKIAGL